ncbi:hypothetical protein BKA81DRAFT_163526 [Phyllosticta paracitricarpa]
MASATQTRRRGITSVWQMAQAELYCGGLEEKEGSDCPHPGVSASGQSIHPASSFDRSRPSINAKPYDRQTDCLPACHLRCNHECFFFRFLLATDKECERGGVGGWLWDPAMRNECVHAAIRANTLMSFPAVMTAPPTPTPSAHLPSQRRIRKHARMMESVCRSFTFSPPSASTAPCRSSSDPRKEAQAGKRRARTEARGSHI